MRAFRTMGRTSGGLLEEEKAWLHGSCYAALLHSCPVADDGGDTGIIAHDPGPLLSDIRDVVTAVKAGHALCSVQPRHAATDFVQV
jgi:hypothetical protein